MNFLCDVRHGIILLLTVIFFKETATNVSQIVDNKYHLASEAYNVARNLFDTGRTNYNLLKNTSLHVMDTFLDLVHIMNHLMAKELRSAVIKLYKIKYFHDFTNYVISLEEMIDIIEHCQIDPVEKIDSIRKQFHIIINNFEDVRHFDTVNKCMDELPDEVAAAHCILHQAVLFNETMQGGLVSIVEIKTNQHARRMNASMHEVRKCLDDIVPHFFEQSLIDAYTEKCSFLDVVKAAVEDLVKDKWGNGKSTLFPRKWSNLVYFFKQRSMKTEMNVQQSLLLTLLSANLTSLENMKTFYS